MSVVNPDVVIMAGGRGTRIGSLAVLHGCKSLIPVAGWAAIEYVLRAVRLVTSGRVFLCIERPKLFPGIYEQMQRLGSENAEIYLDATIRGTTHALYKLRDKLGTDNVLVLYGHHLIKPRHLREVIDRSEVAAITSLYRTSSNNPRDIVSLSADWRVLDISRGNERVKLQELQYYIDPPYRFSREFIQVQEDRAIRAHDAIREWLDAGNCVYGNVADFPHEFHYPEEVEALVEFAIELQRDLIKQ